MPMPLLPMKSGINGNGNWLLFRRLNGFPAGSNRNLCHPDYSVRSRSNPEICDSLPPLRFCRICNRHLRGTNHCRLHPRTAAALDLTVAGGIFMADHCFCHQQFAAEIRFTHHPDGQRHQRQLPHTTRRWSVLFSFLHFLLLYETLFLLPFRKSARISGGRELIHRKYILKYPILQHNRCIFKKTNVARRYFSYLSRMGNTYFFSCICGMHMIYYTQYSYSK